MLGIKQFIQAGDTMHTNEIGVQIRILSNMIFRYLWSHGRSKEVEKITSSNGWILGYLAHNKNRDIFQRDLEEKFSVRRSTASKTITLMEQKGLIQRERVNYDARLRKLVLTPKGREIHEIVMQDIQMAEQQLTNGLTDEEKTVFMQIIEKMKQNIQEECDKNGVKA